MTVPFQADKIQDSAHGALSHHHGKHGSCVSLRLRHELSTRDRRLGARSENDTRIFDGQTRVP